MGLDVLIFNCMVDLWNYHFI